MSKRVPISSMTRLMRRRKNQRVLGIKIRSKTAHAVMINKSKKIQIDIVICPPMVFDFQC
jgi:hypothetical protein